jgi:hypothetical protein
MTDRERDKRTWLLPVGLLVLVVVLVVIALARGPITFEPDTPEGTVQEYLQAIKDERWEDAIAVIHTDWLGSCDTTDLERWATTDFTAKLGTDTDFDGVAERLVEPVPEGSMTTLPEDTETVEVTITHVSGPGLGSSWDEYVAFRLIQENGSWWLADDPWPYFVYSCRDR